MRIEVRLFDVISENLGRLGFLHARLAGVGQVLVQTASCKKALKPVSPVLILLRVATQVQTNTQMDIDLEF
jgi:hypothetical protein